jgi:hypothetical protein
MNVRYSRDAIVAAMRDARAELRREGIRDTMDAVLERVGGSKSTINKYWGITDPAEPEFTLETLRSYYWNRLTSCWPQGICPPLPCYPLLKQIWKECDVAMADAEREARIVQSHLGQLPSTADTTALRTVEARRSAAAMIANSIKSDMWLLEQRARDHGITL